MDRQITKESIDGLIYKLNLPSGDIYCQGWEYEIADSKIAIQVLSDYIERDDLTEDERFTLMHVILESINDFISINEESFPLIEEFKMVVTKDYSLHKQTLEEWACWEQIDIHETFKITPLIRKLIKDIES